MEIQNKAVDLTTLAIGVIVLSIVVAIGGDILLTFRDSRLTDLSNVTTVNETLTTVTHSGEYLSNAWAKSVTQCVNATDGIVIPTANYTATVNDFGNALVKFSGTVQAGYNNTNWKCTYTWYNTSRPDYKLANDSAIGLGEYGNWFKIIVIVGVAALILAIIFSSFGGGSRIGSGESGGSY